MNNDEWEAAGGLACPLCGQETVRLKEITPGNWGCQECYRKKMYEESRAIEYIAMALTYRSLPKKKRTNAFSSRPSP